MMSVQIMNIADMLVVVFLLNSTRMNNVYVNSFGSIRVSFYVGMHVTHEVLM